MSSPVTDPGACWVRHITRAGAGEGYPVMLVRFKPEPHDGINGRQGWASATPELRLSDDGSFTVRLPAVAGEDGKLHADRFKILTDPLYRPGEEWLEFYREPRDLIMVGTPVRARRDGHEIELSGLDAGVLLANARSSEIDTLVGAAPFEVFERYTSAPVLRIGADFSEWNGTGPLPGGFGVGVPAVPTPAGDGILLGPYDLIAGTGLPPYVVADQGAGFTARDWVCEVRWRHLTAGTINTQVGGVHVFTRHDAAGYMRSSISGTDSLGLNPVRYPLPGAIVHRLVARGEWVFAYANGELLGHVRRDLTSDDPFYMLAQVGDNGTAVLQHARLVTLEPLLMRGGAGDRRLPGTPPPGGLRGRYYLEQDTRRQKPTDASFLQQCASPLLEPYAERLDTKIEFAGVSSPTWQPPGPPSGQDFSARWTGAIYLDLATSDRQVSLALATQGGRVWIGGRLVIDQWTTTAGGWFHSPPLRALLDGAVAGWYPIRVEAWFGRASSGIYLADGPVGGTLTTIVPAGRLSPLGTIDHEARHQPHREIVGEFAETFGYQWRMEPRALESGEFPGQFVPRLLAGDATALVVDSDSSMEITQELDATDAIDALVVDASGLADATEGAQISHEAYLTAVDHLMYHQGYESLADISEAGLLRVRTESLLALRSGPNEVVGVRPEGQREIVPRFPLALGTPELVRMTWRPGDSLRIRHREFGVTDATPRQLTVVTWPMRPDGAAPPVVAFRQRARGARALLENTRRAALAPQRHPQGRVLTVQGSIGSFNSPPRTDTYSRLAAPSDLERLLGLELVVMLKTGAGSCTIQVNGVAAGTFTHAGTYDVHRFATRISTTDTRVYATVTGAGAEVLEFLLVARVRH